MEIVTRKRMMIFSGSSYPQLAHEVANELGMRVGDVKLSRFANGELYARFAESVRGSDVFVMQSHVSVPGGMSVNDFIIEQLIMLDALKRASAKRTVAVIPYYGYARSDKKALAREAIVARMVADHCADFVIHGGLNTSAFVDAPSAVFWAVASGYPSGAMRAAILDLADGLPAPAMPASWRD